MTASIYNKEHRRFTSAKIVAAARSILSGELSVVAGARQLATWRFDVGAEHDSDFTFFVGVDSETDHLPVGDALEPTPVGAFSSAFPIGIIGPAWLSLSR